MASEITHLGDPASPRRVGRDRERSGHEGREPVLLIKALEQGLPTGGSVLRGHPSVEGIGVSFVPGALAWSRPAGDHVEDAVTRRIQQDSPNA